MGNMKMKKQRNHYVYRLYHPTLKMWYIGVRTCDKPIEKDDNYRGSLRYKKWVKQWHDLSKECTKTILATFDNRYDARVYEHVICKKKDVAASERYFNGCIPRHPDDESGKPYDTTDIEPWNKGKSGPFHTSKSKSKMSKARKVKVICPHCGVEGAIGRMYQIHFNNCPFEKGISQKEWQRRKDLRTPSAESKAKRVLARIGTTFTCRKIKCNDCGILVGANNFTKHINSARCADNVIKKKLGLDMTKRLPQKYKKELSE